MISEKEGGATRISASVPMAAAMQPYAGSPFGQRFPQPLPSGRSLSPVDIHFLRIRFRGRNCFSMPCVAAWHSRLANIRVLFHSAKRLPQFALLAVSVLLHGPRSGWFPAGCGIAVPHILLLRHR